MCKFKRVFTGKRHVFLPVIHVEGGEQALRNVSIAVQARADGVFLINHSISYRTLIDIHAIIRKQFPKLWIGLNCLDVGKLALNFIPRNTSGLWLDNAEVGEVAGSCAGAQEFAYMREDSPWNGIYFGGVAFKYQAPVKNVAAAARNAIRFVDVITTSGPGTGEAADIEKIKRMRSAIGVHPLAIASGITLENISDYMPYLNCFMVATGISDSHTELNPEKTREMARILRR